MLGSVTSDTDEHTSSSVVPVWRKETRETLKEMSKRNHKQSCTTYGDKVDSSSVIDLNGKLANLVGLVNQVEVITSPA